MSRSISPDRRVGIIGTGSSAIQSVPVIADQAQTPHRVPAHAELFDSRAQRAADRRRARGVSRRIIRKSGASPARRRATASTPICPIAARSTTATMSAAPDTRRAGQRGGLTFMSVYNNLALDKAANDTAADFVREKIARDRQGSRRPQSCCSPTTIRSAPSASASTPIISRPSIAERHAGRHQDQPDRGDHCRTPSAPAARITRSMRWCWRPASTP